MSSNNDTLAIISLILSGIALIISGIRMRIILLKFRLEKSKLHAKITEYWMTNKTNAYPSMEDDNSQYIIHFTIENSGYREELIKEVIFYIERTKRPLEISRMVKAKSSEDFSFEFTRIEMLKLKKIRIIPVEDRSIVIKSNELRKWQDKIVEHIALLKKEWKDGRRIVK